MKMYRKSNSLTFFLLFFFGILQAQSTPEKPNIIVIIADDLGWHDVGYNGSEIKTPNIDFLAKNGVQLNRFYVNPTCSPTRASLLTGRPASRMGIVAPIGDRSKLKLPDSIPTLPKFLKKQGYQTALIGKWHLGLNLESSPKGYGFDYSYGFLHGQIDQYTHLYKNGDKSWYRNGEFIEEEGHTTDLLTNDALHWLSKQKQQNAPFYLQLAYSAPHFPLQEEEKWKKPYKQIQNDSRRDYAAAVAHLDHAIGQVLESLKKQQLDKNTVVVFMSDNGAMENWDAKDQYGGKFSGNSVLGDNTPLRDWKTSNYEGAVRVPCVWYWKNHVKAQENKNYVSVIDFLPTFLGLSGEKNGSTSVEGIDIWQSISENKTLAKRPIYIRGHLQACVIQEPWKLVKSNLKKGTPSFELFNLETDPEEKNNVFLQEPTLAKTLTAELENQMQKDAIILNK
ncbi:sulfatase-like hydrolase/transferase [Flavobacterium agrisoli]|uniref:Sulfatase-like hydrolase/transferase n=1 Tax=Flavobacterium agrisoli TaxID=2793066 RepID=A0A934PMN1_9FLAO|nr:sulfatase-like hydrolase/transferase [Flavobacterium agrisoli]MBK0369276.1 sulfatase-like hydrolase/transferase [Flavobacterium agrisoli]